MTPDVAECLPYHLEHDFLVVGAELLFVAADLEQDVETVEPLVSGRHVPQLPHEAGRPDLAGAKRAEHGPKVLQGRLQHLVNVGEDLILRRPPSGVLEVVLEQSHRSREVAADGVVQLARDPGPLPLQVAVGAGGASRFPATGFGNPREERCASRLGELVDGGASTLVELIPAGSRLPHLADRSCAPTPRSSAAIRREKRNRERMHEPLPQSPIGPEKRLHFGGRLLEDL